MWRLRLPSPGGGGRANARRPRLALLVQLLIEYVAPVVEFMSPAAVYAAPYTSHRLRGSSVRVSFTNRCLCSASDRECFTCRCSCSACSNDHFRGASDRVHVTMGSTSPRDRVCIVLTRRGLSIAYSCDRLRGFSTCRDK